MVYVVYVVGIRSGYTWYTACPFENFTVLGVMCVELTIPWIGAHDRNVSQYRMDKSTLQFGPIKRVYERNNRSNQMKALRLVDKASPS